MARPRKVSPINAATTKWEWACAEQEEFFLAGPTPLLASGGFNSAKTTAAILKLLYLADTFPGYRVVLARRFYSELKQTTMQTFLKLCPPSAYAEGSKSEGGGLAHVTLNNGSRFLFMHLDRPDASSIIMGLEINAALLDQAEEMHEEVYDLLESRLGRWDKVVVKPEIVNSWEAASGKPWPFKTKDDRIMPPSYMLLTCNPDLETHWLWRRFHPDSEEHHELWNGLGYKMITFETGKNKFASQENIKILESKDQVFKDRYMLGKWGNAEGTLFKVSPQSIIEPSDDIFNMIRKTCRLYRILDHGDAGVTCCLWAAVDGDLNVWIYREYYVADKSIREHREAITALSRGDQVGDTPPRYTWNIADPAIFHMVPKRVGGRNVSMRWSVAEEWADGRNYPKESAINWNPADNSEMASRERLADYLHVDMDRTHPVTRTKGAPRLYFIKRTPEYPNGALHSIVETRGARRIQVGSMNGRPVFGDERDDRIPDHALDCLRYLILSRPPAARPKSKVAGRMTWQGYADLTKAWRKQNRANRASWM